VVREAEERTREPPHSPPIIDPISLVEVVREADELTRGPPHSPPIIDPISLVEVGSFCTRRTDIMRRCYLVCYDIRHPRRLRRVHQVMKGYGEPWQYSIFFCFLRAIDRVRMRSDLPRARTDKPGPFSIAERMAAVRVFPFDGLGTAGIIVLPFVGNLNRPSPRA
jgi:CRISPR/Cas system-associated endoribonuclease Cas2